MYDWDLNDSFETDEIKDAEEVRHHFTTPRLLLGGAVIVLVCLCAVVGFLFQKESRPLLRESEPESICVTLVEPETNAGEQTPTFPCPTLSYAVTDENRMPAGTHSSADLTDRTLKDLDSETLLAIWNAAADADDLYFTIRLENGCGLVFSSGDNRIANYGTLDENDYISSVYGYVIRREDESFLFVPSNSQDADSEAQPSAEGQASVEPEITHSHLETTQAPAAHIASSAQADQSNTVYVTNSGTKYHRAGCGYLRSSKIAMSRAEAKEKGYTACSRCNP